jgi:hypothetical protein
MYYIGGNAALMAQHLAASGVSVLLGGPTGPGLRPLLHHSVQLAGMRSQLAEFAGCGR